MQLHCVRAEVSPFLVIFACHALYTVTYWIISVHNSKYYIPVAYIIISWPNIDTRDVEHAYVAYVEVVPAGLVTTETRQSVLVVSLVPNLALIARVNMVRRCVVALCSKVKTDTTSLHQWLEDPKTGPLWTNLYRRREQTGMGPQSIPLCAVNIFRLVVLTRTLRVWCNEAMPNVGNCCRV